MDHRSERITLPNGVVAETATIIHEGREYTAGGSYVDKAGGRILGYVSRDGSELTTWGGERICGLRMVSRFRAFGNTVFAYRAVIDGHSWHGRGSGPGMLLRLRLGR